MNFVVVYQRVLVNLLRIFLIVGGNRLHAFKGLNVYLNFHLKFLESSRCEISNTTFAPNRNTTPDKHPCEHQIPTGHCKNDCKAVLQRKSGH